MYSDPWSPYEPVRWYDCDDHQYHRNVLVTVVVDNEDKNLLITIVLLVGVFDGFQPLIADCAEALTFAKTQSALFLVTGHTGDAIEGSDVSALLPDNVPSDLLGWLAERRAVHTKTRLQR
jgi:hypothetical protein